MLSSRFIFWNLLTNSDFNFRFEISKVKSFLTKNVFREVLGIEFIENIRQISLLLSNSSALWCQISNEWRSIQSIFKIILHLEISISLFQLTSLLISNIRLQVNWQMRMIKCSRLVQSFCSSDLYWNH